MLRKIVQFFVFWTICCMIDPLCMYDDDCSAFNLLKMLFDQHCLEALDKKCTADVPFLFSLQTIHLDPQGKHCAVLL